MDEGSKQLGALVISIVVVVAIIVIAKALFAADGGEGTFKDYVDTAWANLEDVANVEASIPTT